MAKTIDVTLASMKSNGLERISPKGVIRAQVTRAVDDEEVHHQEILYFRLNPDEPMHPSGAFGIRPGQSLSFNVTKRLAVAGDENGDGQPDEMLIFDYDLEESELEKYQGSFKRQVRFEDIDGFTTVTCDYNARGFVVVEGVGTRPTCQILATYTINLISG
jgi:hypothetical protein